MTKDVLLVDENGGVMTLTLNRPKVMNSINFDLLNAMQAVIDDVRFRPEIRAVIITGAGDRAFCAGADLKERATLKDSDVKRFIFGIRGLSSSIENLNKPVIAAVNGIALGGGTELALACDMRIASENATMGLTETRLAIIPGGGGTQRLPRLIGPGKAKELIFTGRRVKAGEALAISLVNSVSSPGDLMKDCLKITDMISETGPIAVEQAKYAINYGMETDLRTGLAIESNAYWVTIPTKDRMEGLNAFREKRKPVFRGE